MTGDEIKVLLTADAAQLQAGMEAGGGSVADLGAVVDAITGAITDAFAGLADALQANVALIAEITATAAESFHAEATAAVQSSGTIVRARKAVAESEEAGTARRKAAIAASLAEVEANSGIVESERSVAERMGLRTEATAAQIDATEAAIAAQDEQMVSMDAFIGAEEASTAAITENTTAIEVNAISSRTASELGVLLSEAASGNFSRMKRSIAALGNSTGVLKSAFTGAGPAILGVTAAVIALGVAAVKGAEEQSRFASAILMSGDAAGVSAGDFEQMAEQVGNSTGSFGDAKTALLAIVESGKITADQIQKVGTASVEMARLTGESVHKAVADFVKLQEKPVQAVVALNDKYHFLTAAVFDQIEALQQQGDTEDAAKVATDAYAASLEKRTEEIDTHLGTLARAWDSVKNSASFAWDVMLNVGKSSTLSDGIVKAQQTLVEFQQDGLATFNSKSGHVGWEATDRGKSFKSVTDWIALLKKLQATEETQQAAATKSAADATQVEQYTKNAAALDKWNAGLKDNVNLQAQIAAKKAEVERVHKEDPNSNATKGYTFDASGAVTGGEQWAATIKKLTKEYGEHLTPAIKRAGAAAHNSGVEARKAASEAMKALQEQRRGTDANSTARIQADAAILAAATKLYGDQTRQQKAALDQMLADQDKYIADATKKWEEAAQSTMQLTVQSAAADLKIKQEQLQTRLALGQVSKVQELELLRTASDQEYQIELDAEKKYADQLDKRTKAYADMIRKIEKLQQDHKLASLKIDDDIQKAMLASWQKALAPINSAFSQSITGMIRGTETFKQALGNMLQSIIASYADMGVKTLTDWIAKEASKKAVSLSTSAALQTQRAADSAADAAASAASIVRASGVAGAQGLASFAGAPWPIDLGAPAFGAAMAADALSYTSFAAEGGWDRVPFDGARTELHKDEMVLPKDLADKVRGMAGGSGGGNMHVTVNAIDAKGVRDLFMNHGSELANALKSHVLRNPGHH